MELMSLPVVKCLTIIITIINTLNSYFPEGTHSVLTTTLSQSSSTIALIRKGEGNVHSLVYEMPLCNTSGSFPIQLCAYSSSFYNALGPEVKMVYSPPPLQYPASYHLLEGAQGSVHSRCLGNIC